MIKFRKHCSTSLDNKWLLQRVNLEKVQNILLADKKISECHTVAM
jgi:coenzyme F420-reducing hydrogenase delta subunit